MRCAPIRAWSAATPGEAALAGAACLALAAGTGCWVAQAAGTRRRFRPCSGAARRELPALKVMLRAPASLSSGRRALRTRQVMIDAQRLFEGDTSITMNPLVAPEAFARDARTALSVNVNKIALLRNSRHLDIPNVVALSGIAVLAGAQGITVHPRPDERHIRTHDVHELAALLREWPHAEYNIEGNPSHNLMQFVRELKPHQCTLVPDSDEPVHLRPWLGPAAPTCDALRPPVVTELRSLGVRVSLFMDPVPEAMRACRRTRRRPRRAVHRSRMPERTARPSRPPCWRATPRPRAPRRPSGLGVNAGPRPEPRQPHRFPARRARRARGVDRPCVDRRCARARLTADRARVPALHPAGADRNGRDDRRHRHRRVRRHRIAAAMQRHGDRFAQRVLGPEEMARVRGAARARGTARPELPGHALLGQGGVLQGHRPGHAHADDLALPAR